ncbi:hypothetical protein AG4045_015944, partial [Apium graveolens]
IKEAHYKKTLLAIVRSLWDKDTINTSGKTREVFLDNCAIDYRVFKYLRVATSEQEKSRADERVKLAISLGYTHATRLMVKPHYFNEGAWESITKHWETEKFKKASEIGRNNRAKLDFNHKSGVVPFCVRRWVHSNPFCYAFIHVQFFTSYFVHFEALSCTCSVSLSRL